MFHSNLLCAGRNRRGSLGALMIAFLVPVFFGIGAFALDLAHLSTVRAELQKATDAAALAGAADLLVDPELCDRHALNVAAANWADGHAVSNEIDGTEVYVETVPCSDTQTGSVTVTASTRLNNLFAKIFHRDSEIATARSVAGAAGAVSSVSSNTAFPLAVSMDTVCNITTKSNNGKGNDKDSSDSYVGPLSSANIGDEVVFYINSQDYKNAAFTSLSEKNTDADWISNAIDQALGLESEVPGYIPSENVGDPLYMINGVAAQKRLASNPQLSALQDAHGLVLPVMTGDPPYTQSRSCIGFITVRISAVDVNQSAGEVEALHCVLIKGLTNGSDRNVSSGTSETNEAAVDRLSASAVKLID